MKRLHSGEWRWLGSDVLIAEVERIPDVQRRERVLTLTSYIHEFTALTQADEDRASALEALGFGFVDALHLACAERAKADVFLTTSPYAGTVL
jgi:predicted nucleic acid-binding protein